MNVATDAAQPQIAGAQQLTHLQQLEAESIHILREVAEVFENPVLLYSIGKDSSVMLHLARKALYPSLRLGLCLARDASGRNEAADRGEIEHFSGLTAPYDRPADADLVIEIDEFPADECSAIVARALSPRLGSIGVGVVANERKQVHLCFSVMEECRAKTEY